MKQIIEKLKSQIKIANRIESEDIILAASDAQQIVEALEGNWISVEDRPLFTIDENGHWVCTEDGDKEFIAAVACEEPSGIKWWIRHCVVEDGVGLCVVGDDENEPAGYELSDVTHWQPLPTPPHL